MDAKGESRRNEPEGRDVNVREKAKVPNRGQNFGENGIAGLNVKRPKQTNPYVVIEASF